MKPSEKRFTHSKRIRALNFDNKENIQHNNSILQQTHSMKFKIQEKTGVEIRNRLKNKQLKDKKTVEKGEKADLRKSHHHILLEKLNKKKQIIDDLPVLNKLSRTSSTQSIKSVTFSLGGCSDRSQTNSSTKSNTKSILKNKITHLKNQSKNNSIEKRSLISSSTSNKLNQQSVEKTVSNSLILEKYQKIYKQLKMVNQKYTDPIYPPYEQSIFHRNKSMQDLIRKLNSDGLRIKWMRLGEIYKHSKSCIWSTQHKSTITKGFISANCKDSDYLQTVFNGINKNYFMQKFFESQQLNLHGIYYVKIHQTLTNCWKYVLVDDYVPVVVSKNDKVVKPAFLNVQKNNGTIQLWPFLLQKAYAKYYSTYDTLAQGRVLDFLEEVTGSFYKTLVLDSLQMKDKVQIVLSNPFNVVYIQNSEGSLNLMSKYQDENVQLLPRQNQASNNLSISFNELFGQNMKIYYIEVCKQSHKINCPIRNQHLQSSELQLIKKDYILRKFTLTQPTNCTLAIIQKEQRFQRRQSSNKLTKYEYSWLRFILVMKQSSGYRWINGEYGNIKTIKMTQFLEQGEYLIMVLPEWHSKTYDLNLALYSNTQTLIQRCAYDLHPKIIQQSCMDLAQRHGTLIQINQNICSYNYIDYKMGLIIENINNQKSFGEVKILRTIDGLEEFNIKPLNEEFREEKKLEITIKSLDSFTVVLRTQKGVDGQFLEQFDFGS